MKKNALVILTALFAIQMASARDVVTQDVQKLPVQAREFISQYFSGEKISYIKIDEEILTTNYDVVFVSGTEIEFTKDGVWKEIDTKRTAIPPGIVPAKIAGYIQQNFNESYVTKIEKKRTRYEVELSNRLDLEFDKDGNFIRIDD